MFDNLIAYSPLLARGALLTLGLAVVSFAVAVVFGAVGAYFKINPKMRQLVIPYHLANIYSFIVRGIPDLVMMLLIYYGGQRLINSIAPLLGYNEVIDISPFLAGVLTLAFIFGAYLTEVFRGAYLSVPRGQIEAAVAIGLSPFHCLVRIIMPQLVKYAIAGINNIWQVLLKSTALVSVIGLEDIVGLADKGGKSVREPFIFFLAIIFVYLFFTAFSNWAFNKWEARVNLGANRGAKR